MTEPEILDLILEATGQVFGLVSIYFAVISVYFAALSSFIRRAGLLIRVATFATLSGAFVFLGLAAIALERTLSGLLYALNALPERAAAPPDWSLYMGLAGFFAQQYWLGVVAGWVMAGLVYLGLFHLTFLHAWDRRAPEPAS